MTQTLTNTPVGSRRTTLVRQINSYLNLPARIGNYHTLPIEITVKVPVKGTRNLFNPVKISSYHKTAKLIYVKGKKEFWLWHPNDLSSQRLPTRFTWNELPLYFSRLAKEQYDFRQQLPRRERNEPIKLSMHITQLTGMPPVDVE
ncbi:hypothetical protein IT401_00030 [Candidatus Nomurabacteria bacterium]|nr:hypothetical protein [Candidatus Nomurabacteria bacterium]